MVHAMIRDQQIHKALKLLAPPRSQRTECQHDIKMTLDRVERGAAVARSFRMAARRRERRESDVTMLHYDDCTLPTDSMRPLISS